MSAVLTFLAERRKAIIAAVVGGVSAYATRHGLDLSQSAADVITVVLTTISVYLVPNQPKA
jgi:hypothetical protein